MAIGMRSCRCTQSKFNGEIASTSISRLFCLGAPSAAHPYIIFARDQHGRSTKQLQILLCDRHLAQVDVDNLYAQVQCLVVQLERLLHLNHPVDQQRSHPRRQVRLPLHVRADGVARLALPQIREDVHGVLGRLARVVPVLAIEVVDAVRHLWRARRQARIRSERQRVWRGGEMDDVQSKIPSKFTLRLLGTFRRVRRAH